MNILKLTVAITALVGILSSSVDATPITLEFSGNASGSIGGRAFTDSNFVITGFGDTLNVESVPGFPDSIRILVPPGGSAQITIDGLGPISFTTPLSFFSNNGGGTPDDAFFGLATPPATDLVFGPTDSVFSTWDMTTSLGPISSASQFLNWGGILPIETSAGRLVFNNADEVSTTFTATVIPVPVAAWLFGSGLLGLVGIVKFQRQSDS